VHVNFAPLDRSMSTILSWLGCLAPNVTATSIRVRPSESLESIKAPASRSSLTFVTFSLSVARKSTGAGSPYIVEALEGCLERGWSPPERMLCGVGGRMGGGDCARPVAPLSRPTLFIYHPLAWPSIHGKNGQLYTWASVVLSDTVSRRERYPLSICRWKASSSSRQASYLHARMRRPN